METSEKTGLNVKEAFATIGEQVIRAFDPGILKIKSKGLQIILHGICQNFII